MGLLTHYNKLLQEKENVFDILPQLRHYAFFVLAGLYSPKKINDSNRFKKFSLTNNNKPNWKIYIHIGRGQRLLEHGKLGDLGNPVMFKILGKCQLTKY